MEHTYYQPEYETMPLEELKALQSERLVRQVQYVYDHVEYYRKKMYEKVVKDLGETGRKFQEWWNRMADKYQWERHEGGNWEIDFHTNDIYLVHGTPRR